ncbi:TetR/AcrR family transcriptional regulator [Mycolicibacterium aubagnense]|uniref:Transcriptional regulator n=1 Tax=Mycolicibacterium aubagnense TaxID=319707 RepID=A0ABM7ILD2_9MYCO|nr:TetR/AcrR family transcriptional regulator [Mycolicibacterium aubagnense]TLH65351.1 TetR family transcriptional regulator [Mycolicibacterium aubagnense]WGI31041.1 TetR/AcrR family transcriptional regulator [Mycolicibacterium aubagnense]BBX87588.1 transcriptional regulator [Mycolicibacterium aubagnense]
MDWLIGAERRDAGIERIYAAAAASAAARGLDRLNIDEVAASVGCSRATVYRYVGGKQALRDGVLARAIARVGEEIAEAVSGCTGPERMAAAVLSAVRVVRADPVASNLVRTGALADFDSPRLAQTAGELSGTADPLLADWIVRVVLSLLCWPLADERAEELVVRRYVAATAGPVGRP